MATRTLDPDATRAAILAAAEDHFVEHGFAAASIADIARSAGVTKSLIHHHFKSKDDLWEATKERVIAPYLEAQRHLLENDEDGEDLLERSIVTYFRYLQQNPRVVRMIAWLDIKGDPKMDEMGRRVTELGVVKIADAQKQGLIRADLEPAFVIISFIGLVQHWFRACEPISFGMELASKSALDERYLQTMLSLFLNGILTDDERVARRARKTSRRRAARSS
jgi:TetR/AcrR family transcriptional regulator